MADLDLLRDINNTYGHLAGDAVLQGIAEVFRAAAAPLRRACQVRRRGVRDPAARDARRSRRFEIAERIRRTVAASAFDVETSSEPIRATDLDRRRRLPARRRGRERADPPGRPRRLPREAPGTQPRPRRELGAAAPAREAAGPARRRAGGRGPRRAAPAGRRIAGPAQERRHPRPHAHARTAFPVALEAARRLRRRGQRRRRDSGRLRRRLRHQHGLDRSPGRSSPSSARARRSPSRWTTARSPSARSARWPEPRCSALGRRSLSRSRRRRSSGAPAEAPLHYVLFNVGTLSLASLAAASVFSAGFDGDLGATGLRGRRHRRRRQLLRRQHGPAQPRSGDRGPRALVGGLQGALRLARDALPRLRLHRRRDLGRRTTPAASGRSRSSPCRCS